MGLKRSGDQLNLGSSFRIARTGGRGQSRYAVERKVIRKTGLQVMAAIMEEDVTAACGPKGRHDPKRRATRHGHGHRSGESGRRWVARRRSVLAESDGDDDR